MSNSVINLNGQILKASDEEKIRISIFDRGFLYGDSLYEVLKTHRSRPLYLNEHLDRLKKSAQLCHMKLSQSLEDYQKQIQRTLDAYFQKNTGEAYCRIIVTRGVGKIGFGLSCIQSPTQYVIIVQALELPTVAQFEVGYHFKIVSRLRNDPRALDPAMKSGNYLNSLLAYLEATQEGYDDALFCNADGHLTEGTTFNIFYARHGIIATPPLDIGILDGITRRKLIHIAKKLKLEVREVRFPKERLYEADEVFISSTIKDAFPVTSIDRKRIGKGKPGPITRQLRKEFATSL